MTAQPSQETVKPEPVTQQDKDLLYQLRSISPKPEDPNGLVWSQYYAIAAYRRAATQKLEAEKAELQRQVDVQSGRVTSAVFAMNLVEEDNKNLRSQLEGMTKALEEIFTWWDARDGHLLSHYHRTRKRLESFRSLLTTQPQPAAGMEGSQS